jgi:hypothetical protein
MIRNISEGRHTRVHYKLEVYTRQNRPAVASSGSVVRGQGTSERDMWKSERVTPEHNGKPCLDVDSGVSRLVIGDWTRTGGVADGSEACSSGLLDRDLQLVA